MFINESYIMTSGVILSRTLYGENTYYLTLFLKQYGLMNVTSIAHLYAGDKEPLTWAVFKLRKKTRSRNYYVEDTDIKEDMLNIRKSKGQILTALSWCKLLIKYLDLLQPDDELLNNLFWSMKLLCDVSVPPEASNWRFLWRWLNLWGLAPDIDSFLMPKRFTRDEIMLLSFVADSNTKTVSEFFKIHSNITGNFFRKAYDLSVKLLNEK